MRTCNNIKFLRWVDVAVLYVCIAVCIARHDTYCRCRLVVSNNCRPCFYTTVFPYMPFQSFEHVIPPLPPECYCYLYASLNTFVFFMIATHVKIIHICIMHEFPSQQYLLALCISIILKDTLYPNNYLMAEYKETLILRTQRDFKSMLRHLFGTK